MVRGCATIPRFRSDASPCWLIPNCWRVLARDNWNQLARCDLEYIMMYSTTITLRFVSCCRSPDIRVQLIALMNIEKRFATPACVQISWNWSGSITGGCGSYARKNVFNFSRSPSMSMISAVFRSSSWYSPFEMSAWWRRRKIFYDIIMSLAKWFHNSPRLIVKSVNMPNELSLVVNLQSGKIRGIYPYEFRKFDWDTFLLRAAFSFSFG